MDNFLKQWAEAAYTSSGFFWMALWVFVLGYLYLAGGLLANFFIN